MKTFYRTTVVVIALTAACASAAYAGKPVTKHYEGFITNVDQSVSTPGIDVNYQGKAIKIVINKDTLIMKNREAVKSGDIKVGDKVHVEQMLQDGKTVYTAIDII